jgi:hypothetical protein
VGLAGFLIREIGSRTAHEITLADERRKLQADIVLRLEVEQQLRVAQQTLEDAVDSISEGFVIYDRNDGVDGPCSPASKCHKVGSSSDTQ